MFLSRTSVYTVLILCLITVCVLFNIKDSVMTIRMELREVSKQMQYESDTIHLLKAELAYLASPERLQKLNKDHLALNETKVSQMISDPLQVKAEHSVVQIASKLRANNVKWRYKKGPSKYLTLVAAKSAR
jgi:hypothetical protein